MTYEKSTRTHGRPVAVDKTAGMKRDRSHHSPFDGYVWSGNNLIRKEYNWDDSYML